MTININGLKIEITREHGKKFTPTPEEFALNLSRIISSAARHYDEDDCPVLADEAYNIASIMYDAYKHKEARKSERRDICIS